MCHSLYGMLAVSTPARGAEGHLVGPEALLLRALDHLDLLKRRPLVLANECEEVRELELALADLVAHAADAGLDAGEVGLRESPGMGVQTREDAHLSPFARESGHFVIPNAARRRT